MGADSTHAVGSTVDSGSPDIQGSTNLQGYGEGDGRGGAPNPSGAFYSAGKYVFKNGWSTVWQQSNYGLGFKASNSNSIYGASTIVQPPAFFCYFWKRLS